MIDAAAVTTFVNPKMARMLGYAVERDAGPADVRLHGRARPRGRARERAPARAGISEQHDFRLTRKDGSDLWTAMSTSAAFDDAGRYAGALAMVTDITERRRAEEALRESEARFRSLTVLSSDWYWEHDEEFRLTQVVGGRAYDNNVGLRRVIGQRPWEAASDGMDPADWDRHRRQLEAHEPFRDFEITHRAPTAAYTVSVSGEPVFDRRAASPATAAWGATSPSSAAARRCAWSWRRSCASRRRWRRSACWPAASRTTSTTCWPASSATWRWRSRTCRPSIRRPPAWSRSARPACAGAAWCSRSWRSRAASRARWSAASCGRWWRSASALLRSTLPAGVTLDAALRDEPLFVMADATQVEQVLMNLCTNAWHSLGGKPGRVAVALAGVELDAAAARQLGARPDAGRVRAPERGGQRPRHGRRDAGAHLRAVLHHQAGGRGHRARAGGGARHHRRARRRHPRADRARRGQHVRDLPAALRQHGRPPTARRRWRSPTAATASTCSTSTTTR